MRTFTQVTFLLILSVFTASTLRAQDAATDAANAAAMQANQQAMEQAQHQVQQAQAANDTFMQQLQQANSDAAATTGGYHAIYVAKPTFTLKQGTYSSPQQVFIHDSTRDAVIYYTTDGWTPTAKSIRYRGPVTVDETMKLQAVAIVPGPYLSRSLVASAQYNLLSAKPAAPALVPPASALPTTSVAQQAEQWPAATNATPIGQSPVPVSAQDVAPRDASGGYALQEGTRIHLVFASDVNSKTAEVGDKVALTVDQEICSGNDVVVPRGAQGFAIITAVNRTGIGGAPGDIAIKLESLTVNGVIVELQGHEVMEGEVKEPNATSLIPVVGAFAVFKHGKDAQIKAGMPVTAYVYADTLIPPVK